MIGYYQPGSIRDSTVVSGNIKFIRIFASLISLKRGRQMRWDRRKWLLLLALLFLNFHTQGKIYYTVICNQSLAFRWHWKKWPGPLLLLPCYGAAAANAVARRQFADQ